MGGAKTLGCCSHVASVLWFLRYKRHISPNYAYRSFGNEILDITKRTIAQNELLAESDQDVLDDDNADSD